MGGADVWPNRRKTNLKGIEMRVLCLFIPHLPLQVEGRDCDLPGGEPVIIGGLPHERKAVCDASPQAVECGVKTGMPLRHAYSLCPGAHFLPAGEEKYDLAFEGVLDVLDNFSPVVEKQATGMAFIDATGLGRYYKGEANLAGCVLDGILSGCGLTASAGVADNRFLAGTAAVLGGPGKFTLVPEGGGRIFLSPLPVDVLHCPEEPGRQLRLLGIRTVGEVAGLGADALTAQFGEEGALLYRLACGIDESPLVRRQKPDRIERELEFYSDTLDGLLGCVGEALDGLSERLKERWQLCRRMEVLLRFDDGDTREEVLDLKVPTRSVKTLVSLLRLRLERAGFESPVCGANVALSGFCEDGKQARLPVGVVGRRRGLAQATREIRGRMGVNMVKRPVLTDEEAFLPERRFVLRDVEI